MDVLYLPPTGTSPLIRIDSSEGILEFRGRSSPENAVGFFFPVFETLGNLKYRHSIDVVFDMDYFNSSSAKCFFRIFLELSLFSKEGTDVKVNWVYEEYDDDMKEVGMDIEDLTGLTFNYLPYSDEVGKVANASNF